MKQRIGALRDLEAGPAAYREVRDEVAESKVRATRTLHLTHLRTQQKKHHDDLCINNSVLGGHYERQE